MNKKKNIILGIDPGTRVTGYGIIALEEGSSHLELLDYGCIRPPAKERLTIRYRLLFDAVSALVQEHVPLALSIETQYVNKNAQSSLKLGMARGVITLAATLLQIPVFEYAPSKAKQAVTGNGKASKVQVQGMVAHLLRLRDLPKPEDAADALALAICHAHSSLKGWHHSNRL